MPLDGQIETKEESDRREEGKRKGKLPKKFKGGERMRMDTRIAGKGPHAQAVPRTCARLLGDRGQGILLGVAGKRREGTL